MLRTRIITAVVLLIVLLAILSSGSWLAFATLTAVFFAVASWECLRLFGNKSPVAGTVIWVAAFVWLVYSGSFNQNMLLPGLCVAIWALRLTPSLALGLPPQESVSNKLLAGIYGIALLGAFLAILVLFERSVLYMFSVMTLVWIADVGAYFSGKAFGKRKLAPSISPGKSWEGAIGGALLVVLAGCISLALPALQDTFAVQLHQKWGLIGMVVILLVVVAASVVGDLFESQLKRRAGMKDSSNLLPGHGGVLDRLDALIPTVPLAVLVSYWL
ncbi:phosphatidate cytidylyltransferase [Oxalicibacterium faecigallinarum]|uniref:Phosphatidate cytidylyltransferase n=1 Tax=Oxalicibacterium faecigallinarum TaxID=573741 RepID=A0A8J3F1H4_9BURK|nr:phosphatidate cytidylyltransferase [Oxalicibacterium faecigallinarum]GGI16591.1 phosphatidate cytidylyltransferase [Oxalicibacterium faecigallinarum]